MKKFFGVIGNPPYQEESVGDQKTFTGPIYHDFIDESYKVSEKTELITPARFLFNAGSTPSAWNKKMLNDSHTKVLFYEADSKKVFPNQDIKGGVAVTYHDAAKDYGAIEIFTPYDELNSILNKVRKYAEFETLSDIVKSRTSYRLTDIMHEEHPDAIKLLSSGHPYDMSTNIFELLPFIFFDDEPNDNKEYVQVYGREQNQRTYKYIRKDYLKTPDNFEDFKVILPAANGSGAIGEVLTTPLIGAPLIGHTESFISIGSFKTEAEAKAALKYIKSKFARAMLGILKATQHNPPEKWKFVPLQDFTSSSDIDWSQSVHEIDVQLYKKYGLSDDEIEFIETHVKEME